MKAAATEQHLFAQALDCATRAERDAYLAGACGGDAATRRRVEELLAATERAGDFLENPAVDLGAEADFALSEEGLGEKVGDRIARYRLLEKIGEGGCGVVYMAEQEEPVRRRVALKIIKPGMDTRAVIARFEAERQALALMEHPNIARVFDGGATSAGRPYFVMELVRGVPITEYCDAARLGTAERLALFIEVCQAVQHAHQKGIIHRDLKPSNILVTVNDGAAVPRVIDFGIAKATGGRLTDKSLFTRFHAFIGTPTYTSPEQAEMSSVDVDTRSDIYSLGVLLYELLTGQTPFDGERLLSVGLDEMRRIIRQDEPARPSQRVSTLGLEAATDLSAKRLVSVPELTGSLRGDLDWIVMKCLEKDRARRYESASGLAADVRRHLENQPVLARSPSRIYRFRKLVARNKLMVVAVAAVTLALIVGTVVSLSQARRAQRGESLAKAALADLRESAPAFVAQGRGLAAEGRYDEAMDKLEYAIRLRPENGEYLLEKGSLLEGQLRFDEALAVYHEALRLGLSESEARIHAALCERLALRERDREWYDALGELAGVMVAEGRSDVERARLGVMLMEEARRRLAAMDVLGDRDPGENLTLVSGGLIGLSLDEIAITDLRPLAGIPLSVASFARCPFVDIRPLADMPLTSLNLVGTKLTDFQPLRSLTSLRSLRLDHSSIVDLSPLGELPVWWLSLMGTEVSDLSPLRGLSLGVLRINDTKVTDLRALAGLPIQELDCSGCRITDFRPLAECVELTDVTVAKTTFEDLAIFVKRSLRTLDIRETRVRDLGPLAGNSVRYLDFKGTLITDLTPLLSCRDLQEIVLPEGAENFGILRSMPGLRRISFERNREGHASLTAEEFWKQEDARKADPE